MFQSTFPRGERPGSYGTLGTNYAVSIHVPARGTTRVLRNARYKLRRFNPRSREGNDSYCQGIRRQWTSFNPRSREGNDIDLS